MVVVAGIVVVLVAPAAELLFDVIDELLTGNELVLKEVEEILEHELGIVLEEIVVDEEEVEEDGEIADIWWLFWYCWWWGW